MKNESLPADYELCGECSFDHSYEPEEAHLAHQLLKMKNYCPSCGEDIGNSDICNCASWDYENQ